MNHYDVIIAGAGPVGGYIAKTLAHAGYHVALMEEHKRPGYPLHCAGLVNPRVLKLTNLDDTCIQNKIFGATIHAPSGKTLTLGGNQIHAAVIDRPKFDATIVNHAKKEEVDILLETKLVATRRTLKNITVQTQHHTQTLTNTCDLLIGADGARSTVRNLFQFPQPREMLQGIGADITDLAIDPKQVHIFVGAHIAPGFFAWIIPTNPKGTTARAGVCTTHPSSHPTKYYFTQLFTHPASAHLLHKSHVLSYTAGMIPLGPLKKTTDTHVMIVGDAAAQVKPTSGGGLYTGLLCAHHCADVALEALQHKQFTQKTLKKYHSLWTADIGKELQLGMRFRRIFTRLSDTRLNQYITKFDNPKIIDVINTYGDIDYPSKLVIPLLKTMPSLLCFLPFLKKNK
ncbi:MAG: NAD(P)/FAD-dependent oxidoreductase [Methanobacteriota archaeon]